MKRFTETEKWSDPWFRKLQPLSKLVLLFIQDNCDVAGFWEIDIEAVAFMCKLPDDKIRGLFEGLNQSQEGLGKVLIQRGSYVWLKDFVSEQKNLPLNPLNNAHRKVISCINARSEFEEAQLLLSDTDQTHRACVSRKEAVWIRDRGVCQYCHAEIASADDYELDHIVPRASHISEVYTNFATACKRCNREKTDKAVTLTVPDYSASLAKQELRNNPTLLLRFNSFFSRNLRIRDESLTELAPPVRGTGSSRVKAKVKKVGMQGEKTEPMKRVEKIFHRRDSTRWSDDERKSFDEITVEDEDVRLLETYYAASIPDEKDIRRKDFVTMLNNWNGEVDRAREWARKNPKSAAKPVNGNAAPVPAREPPDFREWLKMHHANMAGYDWEVIPPFIKTEFVRRKSSKPEPAPA